MHLAAGADYCTKVQHRWGRKMCVPGGAKEKRFVSGPAARARNSIRRFSSFFSYRPRCEILSSDLCVSLAVRGGRGAEEFGQRQARNYSDVFQSALLAGGRCN
jgi:hypothetical protein